jgi:gliding motility-associated-like protein
LTFGNAVINQSGTYISAIKNQYGCDSTDVYHVTKLSWPEQAIIDINCKDKIYRATLPDLADPWKVLWSNNENTPQTTLKDGGTLKASIRSSTGCAIEYSYDLPIIPDITSIPKFDDRTIESGEAIPLAIDLDPIEWNVLWTSTATVACDTCLSTSITATSNADVKIALSHSSGCSFETNFRIEVGEAEEVWIPNIFDPSNDTENNTWTIKLPQSYQLLEASIYDRWGNKVYASTSNQAIRWDGTLNGNRLLPGVYIYHLRYLDAKGTIVVMKGDVTVL